MFRYEKDNDNNCKSKTFGQTLTVAHKIVLECGKEFVLNELTLDELRQLGTRFGLTNLGSQTKFQIRCRFGQIFSNQDNLEEKGFSPTEAAAQTTSNVCWAINVVFSASFVEELKKVLVGQHSRLFGFVRRMLTTRL